jgi:Flp pilus assembly protein TadG
MRQSAVNDGKPVATWSGQRKINAFNSLVEGWNHRFRLVLASLWSALRSIRQGRIAEQDAFGMLKHLAKWSSRYTRHLSRFGRARRAATAVEFALVAPIFIAILVAVLQVAIFLFAQQSLQNAAMQAGRQFMTGQVQGDSQSAFRSLVCTKYLPSIFNCSSLVVVVQSASSFSGVNTAVPSLYSNGQQIPVTNFTYSPGTPGQVMVVQLVYPWTVFGGPLGFSLSNLPGGAAQMMGVSAFRVEPY